MVMSQMCPQLTPVIIADSTYLYVSKEPTVLDGKVPRSFTLRSSICSERFCSVRWQDLSDPFYTSIVGGKKRNEAAAELKFGPNQSHDLNLILDWLLCSS